MKTTAVEMLRTADFAGAGAAHIDNGFVDPMEGPGLGVGLLPAVFERSDRTRRITSID